MRSFPALASIALAPLVLAAACAPQTPSGERTDAAAPASATAPEPVTTADAPDAVDTPAGDEVLRDMRPTDGGPDADCTSTVGAENTCVQGNFRPLPADPQPDEG